MRQPILIAAAGIAGVLAMLAGYMESQAAARFEFEFASVRPQPLSDDQAEASASMSIDRASGSDAPVMAKAHPPAKVHSAVRTRAGASATGRVAISGSSDDVFDGQVGLRPSPARKSWRTVLVRSTELPLDSHVAAEISRIQSNIPTHGDIESLALLAGAAQQRFALGLRVRVMQDGTVMPRHAEKSAGN